MKETVISRSNLFNLSLKSDSYSKYFLTVIFLHLFNLTILKAQVLNNDHIKLSIPSASIIPDSSGVIESLAFANSVSPDTTIQIFKPKLLPDKMSFLERRLWGEKGLVRGIGLSSPLSPEVRKHELDVRRFMLTAHQIGGFTTLGLMLATCYFGQKIIDGGVDGRRDYESTKKTLVAATITSYSLTALLSVLSPPPLIRRDESSTVTLHKTLAWFHVAGMIVTPILGSLINTNRTFNMDKAHYHQIAGYITTAIFATAMIVITL